MGAWPWSSKTKLGLRWSAWSEMVMWSWNKLHASWTSGAILKALKWTNASLHDSMCSISIVLFMSVFTE